ncbi:uncharacterized protein LACBIDRAFT_327644 [Laccaria bicolor S238N-H82]|uniref:Predicted protein n=1 Tax=Laccaria bicolor (strain S238N-H82 / ATCC MYA-4686) TaxID=486041 RepID=B0DCE0_LACBS|nr:uncharacterized protein LACBIDRAFT_327644 [Laccaria bicolor S238N-H82]EDR07712.1 predicted protein [Laccaria bicolor S238N-H82]|eukprot:XP_001881501.1 predicted protein [Laccaria bicolor S238N-H82]
MKTWGGGGGGGSVKHFEAGWLRFERGGMGKGSATVLVVSDPSHDSDMLKKHLSPVKVFADAGHVQCTQLGLRPTGTYQYDTTTHPAVELALSGIKLDYVAHYLSPNHPAHSSNHNQNQAPP